MSRHTCTILLLLAALALTAQDQKELNTGPLSAQFVAQHSGHLILDNEADRGVALSDGGALLFSLQPLCAGSQAATSAGVSYRNGKQNYGPLVGLAASAFADQWEHIFEVRSEEVIAHIADAADGVIDQPIEAIMNWPAVGNPHFEAGMGWPLEGQGLAPFVDINANGQYEPLLGDYPAIKGDHMLWWMQSDPYAPTADIYYGFGTQTAYAAYYYQDRPYTIFIDAKVSNQSSVDITDYYYGILLNGGIGCPEDDYWGYDSLTQTTYLYNSDAYDGDSSWCQQYIEPAYMHDSDIPIMAFSILPGAEQAPVSNVINVQRHDYDVQNIIHYLQGRFTVDDPLTYGGLGQGGDTPAQYAYPGNPADPDQWSMCSVDQPQVEVMPIMGIGPATLPANGGSQSYAFALTAIPHVPHPCPDIHYVRDAVTHGLTSNSNHTLKVETEALKLSPNPTSSKCTIHSNIDVDRVHIINTQGQVVLSSLGPEIDISTLVSGIYMVKAYAKNGTVSVGKIIKL